MKVYVHGNCQSYVVAKMLGELYPRWDISYFEIHADPIIRDNEDYRRAVREADIIIAQPVHDGYRERADLSLSWVRAEARPNAVITVFPSMHFSGHHIGIGELPLGQSYAYDAVAALMISSGVEPDEACKVILSESYLSSQFIESEILHSIAEIKRREIEDKIDIPLSPFLDRTAWSQQEFHIVNHPYRAAYVHVIDGILDHLGYPDRVPAVGTCWQPLPHIPLLPSVRRFLRSNGGTPPNRPDPADDMVLAPNRPPMRLEDFYRAMTRDLQTVPRRELIAATRQRSWSREFLSRLSSASVAPAVSLSDELRAVIAMTDDAAVSTEIDIPRASGSHSASTASLPTRTEQVDRLAESLESALGSAQVMIECGDMAEALRIWAQVRARSDSDPTAYHRATRALREAGRLEEAALIASEGTARFPGDLQTAIEYGWVAFQRGETDAALASWSNTSRAFPDHPAGAVYTAIALRTLNRFDEAEAVLADAEARFPGDPWPASDHAMLSNIRGDWSEASRRWVRFRTRFPDHPSGYIGAAWAFRGLRSYDLADILLAEGEKRFPGLPDLVRDRAGVAHDRGDWEEAARRWARVRSVIPSDVGGYLLGARALLALGRHEEAEVLLEIGCERFPDISELHVELAESLASRGDLHESVRRWVAARRRLPLDRLIQERLFQARLRLLEADPAAAVHESEMAFAAPEDQRVHDLMMSFESLGGARFGCEFGGVQRAFGAEPIGLLRWADLAPEHITEALERRLEGVGLPQNTEIFTYGEGDSAEYGTRDARFHLLMHTFVLESSAPPEKVFRDACRRLQYLSRKLLEDLEGCTKIFVYKLTYDNLTTEQLDRLHAAIRSYGPNTLLYVRYADAGHPNGTVELVKEGLLVGYIDHFGTSRQDTPLPLPVDSWATICQRAYDLWRSEANTRNELSAPACEADSPAQIAKLESASWPAARHMQETTGTPPTDPYQSIRDVLADATSADRATLRDRLIRIAAEHAARMPHDAWFFENFLLACMVCQAFDLGERAVQERFGAKWRCEIALRDLGKPAPVVRWDAFSRDHSRFLFNPGVFSDNNSTNTILFWIRTIGLYDGFHRSDEFTAGVVDVSLWDVGLVPGISFSDNHPSRFLLPDPMFLSLSGYQHLRAEVDRDRIPWSERADHALWRGATTGAWDHSDLATLPRIRLCQIAAESGGRIDAGINSIVQMDTATEHRVRESGLLRPSVTPQDFARRKFQIDIDGNSNSWPGLFHKLYSGSAVLKVESPRGYRQWYYDRLVPWYNFVPVAADMSDICDKIDWLRSNDDRAREIGERGRMLATGLSYEGELTRAAPSVVAAMHQHAFFSRFSRDALASTR